MITKLTNHCGFDEVFHQAVQSYEKVHRSQCRAIDLPPEQTIRASWEKMRNRLTSANANASDNTVGFS